MIDQQEEGPSAKSGQQLLLFSNNQQPPAPPNSKPAQEEPTTPSTTPPTTPPTTSILFLLLPHCLMKENGGWGEFEGAIIIEGGRVIAFCTFPPPMDGQTSYWSPATPLFLLIAIKYWFLCASTVSSECSHGFVAESAYDTSAYVGIKDPSSTT